MRFCQAVTGRVGLDAHHHRIGRRMLGDKKVSGAQSLFEELEGEGPTAEEQRAAARRSWGLGQRKRVLATEPKIRGSPRRLNIVAGLLVGKSYPELMSVLPALRNTGARSAQNAIENARRRARQQWDVKDDNRLVVEQAWTGNCEAQPRLKIHARGKTGVMHRRWGKMWVMMRYISPEDDEATLSKMCAALEKAQVPKDKVRYLLRYGPRTTVFRVSKEAGLTRQQGRAYLKMLSKTRPEFRKPKFEKLEQGAPVVASPARKD